MFCLHDGLLSMFNEVTIKLIFYIRKILSATEISQTLSPLKVIKLLANGSVRDYHMCYNKNNLVRVNTELGDLYYNVDKKISMVLHMFGECVVHNLKVEMFSRIDKKLSGDVKDKVKRLSFIQIELDVAQLQSSELALLKPIVDMINVSNEWFTVDTVTAIDQIMTYVTNIPKTELTRAYIH